MGGGGGVTEEDWSEDVICFLSSENHPLETMFAGICSMDNFFDYPARYNFPTSSLLISLGFSTAGY